MRNKRPVQLPKKMSPQLVQVAVRRRNKLVQPPGNHQEHKTKDSMKEAIRDSNSRLLKIKGNQNPERVRWRRSRCNSNNSNNSRISRLNPNNRKNHQVQERAIK